MFLLAVITLVFALTQTAENAAALRTEQVPSRPSYYYPPIPPRPLEASQHKDDVFYRLRLGRAAYLPRVRIVMDLMVENRANAPIMFSSHPHVAGPSFSVLSGEKVVWRWPAAQYVHARPCMEWFGPGLTKVYGVSWDQKDEAGNFVPPGDYVLRAAFPPSTTDKSDSPQWTELTLEFSIAGLEQPARPPAPDRSARTSLETDKGSYSPGEPVKLRLTITNETDAPLSFHSSNSQRFDFVVRAGDREIWRWSRGKMFAMALSSWELPPGESITYEVDWPQKDNADRAVPPGRYTAEGWQIGGGPAQAEFSIQ